ncbi:MAG: hypothetical protein ACE5H2_02950 [Terriglobia bacterium]
MSRVSLLHPTRALLLPLLAALLFALPAWPQGATGAIELVVRATPTGGRPEKVMRQPFYLLRASLHAIEVQARAEVGEPDRAALVDSLAVSAELQAWMKRTGRFELRGEEFTRALTPDDIMGVPEFFLAYQERNLPFVGFGFPKHKAKPKDQVRNPKKWRESEKRYREELRAYLALHPESKQGLDEYLTYIDSAARWKALTHQHAQRVRHHTVQLVEGRYRVARTETDLEGHARFDNLPPGQYWITNLWNEVRVGDVYLSWDLPVQVTAGRTLVVELSNANTLLPARSTP